MREAVTRLAPAGRDLLDLAQRQDQEHAPDLGGHANRPRGDVVEPERMAMLEDRAAKRDGLLLHLRQASEIGRLAAADNMLAIREGEVIRTHAASPEPVQTLLSC